jgi:hypothetical protein
MNTVDACGDESPDGSKVSALTKTAPRKIRSEQPQNKKTARRRSLYSLCGFDQTAVSAIVFLRERR